MASRRYGISLEHWLRYDVGMRFVLKAIRSIGQGAAQLRERLRWGGTWQQLSAVPGNRPDYVTRLHSALQAEGVRATYQVIGTGGGSPAGGIGAVSQTIKLLVHRDDLHRARRIMARLGE